MTILKRFRESKNLKEKISLLRQYYRKTKVVTYKLPEDEIEKLLEEGPVLEIGAQTSPSFNATLSEYIDKYGRLPKEIYGGMPVENVEAFVKEKMREYEKMGFKTLKEIEKSVKERNVFEGPNTFALIRERSYRIYVRPDELIYDEGSSFFDSQYKRFQIYSEIQHLIAKEIFNKDIAQIRKEAKKRTRKG